MVKLDLKQSIFQLDVKTLHFPNFNKCNNQNHVFHSLVSLILCVFLRFLLQSSLAFGWPPRHLTLKNIFIMAII